ncbi:NTE family protein [Sphingomonas vulcanisoli]|uniref:NTE family protein n=1 Tax=Sphingomonas vulcanisoli TaxID=1658060 RepID=A0ABX0TQ42_9SPHN|nr:NTE family protein [Sphingomonas vulcanisoli]
MLEEAGIPIAAVAGTSIGAVAAVALAAGKIDALEQIARDMTRTGMLAHFDLTWARGALLGGRRIARMLAEQLGAQRFEDLDLPAAVVAADLETGEEVRLSHGPLVSAVQASTAIPGLFPAVVRDGRVLIDGGNVANLPVSAARALAPDRPVLAIDLMGDYHGHIGAQPAHPRSVPATIRASYLMLVARQSEMTIALEKPELLITMPIGHISTGAFHRAADYIALGREATLAALPQICARLEMPKN